jgi:hypothetical protein
MPWAYRDKYGILHATEDEKTAKDYSVSKAVKKYSGACMGGYPAVSVAIIDYGDARIFLAGNEKSGIDLNKAPGTIKAEADRLLKEIGL